MRSLRNAGTDNSLIIFRFDRATSVDATGISALKGVLKQLHKQDVMVAFTGMRPEMVELAQRGGLGPVEGELAFCDNVLEAYSLAGLL